MGYPFWDVGIGYGLLMGTIAVLHVFISHFAIGGGLYLVVMEARARRKSDEGGLEFLRRLSKFFALTTLVLGALTGVGIWFIIGLLNPAATEVLIHNFVWGWAIEWTFFVVEITAALIYYYGWRTMTARTHLAVGWIYFAAAWLSLVIINGIIAFMLTPGRWLTTGAFWDGFFNPTYWPSLVFRTGVCVMLAGVYAAFIASTMRPEDLKRRLVRTNALWGLVGLLLMAPAFYWYWKAIVAQVTLPALAGMPGPVADLDASFWWAAALAAMLVVFGLLFPKRLHPVIAAVIMVLALGYFSRFEWMRESIRKPYVISKYMYGNATEVSKVDVYRSDGLLAHIEYRTGDDGADLFRHACQSCHTMNGYRALRPALDGTDATFIAGLVRGAGVMQGHMPPFLGTEEESHQIGDYIWAHVDHRPLRDIYGLSGVELGRKVYEIRCGRCHEIGGYNDKSETLVGTSAADLSDILDMAGEITPEMPPFTGDATERAALIQYLTSLPAGGNAQ
jgi:mono/diheme cytochrome c family protein